MRSYSLIPLGAFLCVKSWIHDGCLYMLLYICSTLLFFFEFTARGKLSNYCTALTIHEKCSAWKFIFCSRSELSFLNRKNERNHNMLPFIFVLWFLLYGDLPKVSTCLQHRHLIFAGEVDNRKNNLFLIYCSGLYQEELTNKENCTTYRTILEKKLKRMRKRLPLVEDDSSLSSHTNWCGFGGGGPVQSLGSTGK